MKLLAGFVLLALPFAVAHADHRGGRPPQAAFDACASARAGDTCTVAFGDHTMTGVCALAPDSSALACRPDRPRGPPPEAIAACDGRTSGDACSMTHDGHAIAGTCAQGRDSQVLACRPNGARPLR